jgi:hypothetical protein
MTKIIKILFVISIFSFKSCSGDEESTLIDNQPIIYNDNYILEINKSYRIFKVTYSSQSTSWSYSSEFGYYDDSIVIRKYYQTNVSTTTYYINSYGLADSCEYSSDSDYSHRNSKSYFTYDLDSYLIAKTDRSFYSNGLTATEFTDTYNYTTGNLAKVTIDRKRPAITGRYIVYTYNSFPNLIDLNAFTGPWLGKLNKNLRMTMYMGESMSDNPPCSNYHYTLNPEGLVETQTITSCKSSNSFKIVITFKYIIVDL